MESAVGIEESKKLRAHCKYRIKEQTPEDILIHSIASVVVRLRHEQAAHMIHYPIFVTKVKIKGQPISEESPKKHLINGVNAQIYSIIAKQALKYEH